MFVVSHLDIKYMQIQEEEYTKACISKLGITKGAEVV